MPKAKRRVTTPSKKGKDREGTYVNGKKVGPGAMGRRKSTKGRNAGTGPKRKTYKIKY